MEIEVPSNKTTIIIIIAVIVVILLLILGIYLYKTYSNKGGTRGKIVDLIPKIHDGKMKKRINQNLIPNSVQGNEYCFNFWIYINDYTYRFHDKKSIMFKGSETDKESSNPGIWLLDKTNIFRVTIGLQTKDPSSEHLESDTPNVDVCDIKDIPLQRWVNINIGLYNNIIDAQTRGRSPLEGQCPETAWRHSERPSYRSSACVPLETAQRCTGLSPPPNRDRPMS